MTMFALPTVIALTGAISLLISAFYLALSKSRHQGKIAESCTWLAVAYASNGLRLGCQIAVVSDHAPYLRTASDLFYVGWISAFWLGIRVYGEKEDKTWALLGIPVLLATWVMLADGVGMADPWSVMPQHLVGTLVFLIAGLLVWRLQRGDRDNWGLLALAVAMWLQGASTASYPFTRMTWYAPYGFSLLAILTPAMGMGLMVVALIEEQRELRRVSTAREQAEKENIRLAYHDPLTGLPNRLLAQDRFRQATAHANREKCKVALLVLDLDNFKGINDSLGHSLGDRYIADVATRLAGCVRETDTVCRQGGDEYVIILSAIEDAESMAPILVKLMECLAEPCEIGGHQLQTTLSVGVALYPDDGTDFDALLKRADTAMYRAKDAGRNAYRFFDEQMNVDAVERLTIRNGLRQALDRDEFVLHYQPQIDLRTGATVGAEALIRWRHPERGMVPPCQFIPVAEESHLIVPLGAWVLQQACRQAVAWRAAGLPPLVVAVNLSAVQFRRGDVEQTVVNALEASGHDPAYLELELTESILVENVDTVLATVKRLKSLGVKLSIDDFGTGYSSLTYLKQFDIDTLKIDQSFIRDMTSDTSDAAIVRAIIQMGHSLNLQTIAEGVEDEETLAQLRRLGCDQAQGYHFARPMPAGDLAAYLDHHAGVA